MAELEENRRFHWRFLCRFVVNEMIQSEKDYVKDLGVIVEVSPDPSSHLMKWWKEGTASPNDCDLSGLHVQAGGPRDSRRHERQRQDRLRKHPADLRLAPRVSPSGGTRTICPAFVQTAWRWLLLSVSASSWWSWSAASKTTTCWPTSSSNMWVLPTRTDSTTRYTQSPRLSGPEIMDKKTRLNSTQMDLRLETWLHVLDFLVLKWILVKILQPVR